LQHKFFKKVFFEQP